MAPISVLLAADGASWEAEALGALRPPKAAVIKRCVDLPDLLASASTGQAQVAVVDAALVGLDADAVSRMHKHGVRLVSVGPADLGRIGVSYRVSHEHLNTLPMAVSLAARTASSANSEDEFEDPSPVGPQRSRSGRIVAVWGPRGAPGRTTVACALAATRAHLGQRVVLVDGDPFGSTISQHLGVLDEASGLLAAARLVNSGTLEATAFAHTRRSLEGGVELLSGLPRADRWIEVRPGTIAQLLALAAQHADVVVDTGSSLDSEEESPSRHHMTKEALEAADEIVVVGAADAVGLARLARALADLDAMLPGAAVSVVVNKARESLGWSEGEVAELVAGFANASRIDVLPWDQVVCDRAMLIGRAVGAEDDGDLGIRVRELASQVFADAAQQPPVKRASRWRRGR